MNPNHAYFELLCALVELEQLSPSESSEFREHAQSCADCQQRLLDLTELHATMVVTNAQNHPLRHAPRGMTERFTERANRDGVPLNERNPTAAAANMMLASAAVLLLLITGTIVGRNRTAPSPAATAQAAAATSRLHDTTIRPQVSGGIEKLASDTSPRVDLHQPRTSSSKRSRPLMQAEQTIPQTQQTLESADVASHNAPRGDVLSAELQFPETGSLRSSNYPRFKFFAHREIAGDGPNLLTACICSPPAPLDSRTSFALASSARFFQPNVDAYRTNLKPEFRPDPATFQLIENVRQ
jgi:hypothetical protein